MPVLTPADAVRFETHGSRFSSYASPSRGSRELCGWRLDVPPGLRGAAHRPTREELLLVLEGELLVSLDGAERSAVAGDVVLVPAGSEFRVDGGPAGAAAWVSTTPGLQAQLPDGSTITPPWAA
jgi:quercetin dioxygenase-like cupin family protein